ncbi:MAG: hypothetical protein ACOC80_04045 [Petrotogales bacterium]
MRYIAILLLFCLLLLPLSVFSSNSFEHDKYLHFSVSFSMTVTFNYFFGYHGDFLAIGIGFLKEFWDYFSDKGVSDPGDVYANIVGVLTARHYLTTLNYKPFLGFVILF